MLKAVSALFAVQHGLSRSGPQKALKAHLLIEPPWIARWQMLAFLQRHQQCKQRLDTNSSLCMQFGFNNGQTMVDGLYAGSTYQVADFKTIVFRQQQLGFNAVRLPMTFSDLNLPPKSWTKSCTDDTASLKASPLSSPSTGCVHGMRLPSLWAAAADPTLQQ